MPTFHPVARVDEIAPGAAKEIRVADQTIALFNVGGRFYACDDECPHAGFSLAAGDLDGTKVVCFGHGWGFDLDTGACEQMPISIQTYPVQIADGEVQIGLG